MTLGIGTILKSRIGTARYVVVGLHDGDLILRSLRSRDRIIAEPVESVRKHWRVEK